MTCVLKRCVWYTEEWTDSIYVYNFACKYRINVSDICILCSALILYGMDMCDKNYKRV